jgi:putative proteasome-type protease
VTYCVGIRVDEGLVFAADTRTSANVDDIRTYNKLHAFEFAGERVLLLMSAGNLATTQVVLCQIQRDLEAGAGAPSLRNARHVYDVAAYVGRLTVRAEKDTQAEGDFGASWIVGGQIRGDAPALYHVYPEGNFIACSPETPYLQIGETKYGKPILDRMIGGGTSLADAARCALVSLDSSMKANISVGLPLDLAIVPAGALAIGHRLRLDVDTPYWRALRKAWRRNLAEAFRNLPRFEWEETAPRQQAAKAARRRQQT